MKKVFLGGTCNGSLWRETLIPLLKVDYFNPVVKDWTPECQEREVNERETADYVLYVITPKMTGFYSIAEAIQDSNIRPEKILFTFLDEDEGLTFTNHQIKSLVQTVKLIEENGGLVFNSLEEIARFLNSQNPNSKLISLTLKDVEHSDRSFLFELNPKEELRVSFEFIEDLNRFITGEFSWPSKSACKCQCKKSH